MNSLIILPVVISLAASFIISLFFREKENWARVVAICFSFLTLLSVILLGKVILSSGRVVYFVGGWRIPLGILLMADSLSWIFLFVVNFIGFCVLLYSTSYMRKYTNEPLFYILYFLLFAGMNNVLISADFFNIYVFVEIASLSSYALVAFGLRPEEIEASFRYTVLGVFGSILIIFGVAFAYGLTGTVNIPDFMKVIMQSGKTQQLWFIMALFLSGFAIKMALFPFHTWLPDAHSLAPAPVSAVLSGLVIKVLGFYLIIRFAGNIFVSVVGVKTVILVLGILSMVFGGLMALGQRDLKRVFAYSSISQIGYCAVGFGIGGYLGILGALLHFISHSFAKSLLFLDSGAIEYITGTTKIDELKGINDKMPETAMLGNLGMLTIAGVPPMGIFWSKLIIVLAAIKKGYIGVAFTCTIVSIITMGYFLKVIRKVFLSKENKVGNKNECGKIMLFSMFLLGIIVFFIGLILIPEVRRMFLDKAVGIVENFNYLSIINKL